MAWLTMRFGWEARDRLRFKVHFTFVLRILFFKLILMMVVGGGRAILGNLHGTKITALVLR